MANNTEYKPIKVSELKSAKLDGSDMLLVSDREGSNTYSRQLTIQKLVNYIASSDKMSETIDTKVDTQLSGVESLIDDKIDDKISTYDTIDGGKAF